MTTGARIFSGKAYALAGVGPGDIDVAGIYDGFTGTVIMMLEDLGFCRKGEDGPITLGGRIPINTHGGMLPYAHPGLPGGFFDTVAPEVALPRFRRVDRPCAFTQAAP